MTIWQSEIVIARDQKPDDEGERDGESGRGGESMPESWRWNWGMGEIARPLKTASLEDN